jgi:hypothetical protein
MTHLLVRLSDAEFANIPSKVVPRTVRLADPSLEGPKAIKWVFIGYCDKLLNKNEPLQKVLRRFAGRRDDPECRRSLTPGQRTLHSLAALDGQVGNGGIAQFFWNCPDLIIEASESLEVLGETELAAAYGRALEALIGNKEDWLELRKLAGADPEGFWESFQATYDLLDLDWFDTAYFGQHGGLLVARLVNYVQTHRAEFIES